MLQQVENVAMNVKKLEFVKSILRQMVPTLEVLEVLVPQKNLAGPEIALVPQDFAQIASTNVEEDGPQILVKLFKKYFLNFLMSNHYLFKALSFFSLVILLMGSVCISF